MQTTRTDFAANLALFLQAKVDTIFGSWSGRMSAAEQRALFGRFLGKGKLHIDGAAESIEHTIKVCFGLDYETTASLKWSGL